MHGEVELFPGITLRGMRLYQIVEPSIHPKGTEYVWRDRGPIRLTGSQVNTLKARVPPAQTGFKPTDIVRSREVGPVSRPYKKLAHATAGHSDHPGNPPHPLAHPPPGDQGWLVLLGGLAPGQGTRAALRGGQRHRQGVAVDLPGRVQDPSPASHPGPVFCHPLRHQGKGQARSWPLVAASFGGAVIRPLLQKVGVKTKQEQAFADAVVAEILYHILEKKTTEIEFTREQIRTIVFSTHGEYFGLDNNGIYDRQVKKFIGQAEELYVAWGRRRSFAAREASKCSWLVRVRTGKKADGEVYPSAFELGEGFLDWTLDQLFGREATEGHETHHEPDPAESPAPGPGTPPKTREGPPDASRAEKEGESCPTATQVPGGETGNSPAPASTQKVGHKKWQSEHGPTSGEARIRPAKILQMQEVPRFSPARMSTTGGEESDGQTEFDSRRAARARAQLGGGKNGRPSGRHAHRRHRPPPSRRAPWGRRRQVIVATTSTMSRTGPSGRAYRD